MRLLIHGHKPDKLGGWGQPNPVCEEIKHHIREKIKDKKPKEVLLGLDLGVSQWAAEVCLELDVPYTAYIPFTDFSSKWPPFTKQKYNSLASSAKMLTVTHKGGYEQGVYYRRNKIMAAYCDEAILVWDGSSGVTYNLREALQEYKAPYFNLYNVLGQDTLVKIENAYKKIANKDAPLPPPKKDTAAASVKNIVSKVAKSVKKSDTGQEWEEPEDSIEVLAPKRYIEID